MPAVITATAQRRLAAIRTAMAGEATGTPNAEDVEGGPPEDTEGGGPPHLCGTCKSVPHASLERTGRFPGRLVTEPPHCCVGVLGRAELWHCPGNPGGPQFFSPRQKELQFSET